MNDPNHEWPHALVKTESFKCPRICSNLFRHDRLRMRMREVAGQPLHHSSEVENAEKDQHQRNAKLHRKPQAWRDDDAEEDDQAADGEDREGVAKSPDATDEGGIADTPLFADDGRDGDDMIRIGRVPYPKDQAESRDKKNRAEPLLQKNKEPKPHRAEAR